MFSGKIDSGDPFLTLVNLIEGIYFAVVLNQEMKPINTIKFYHTSHE
ncbi:MAG: hypothetical protein HKO66_03705 [Saprospiraceae bacterium]|nr:hypothetical protein [Bacteroidia bacterium]NNE14375.1 hypothetical protein [Saprospiraceae bacterium]NNL91319.1 hypothetical protein [Saprospiraceae bacterium]